VEVADGDQASSNRRYALRGSVKPLMHPGEVAECGRGLSSGKEESDE
jgi:hypothetical protein